MLSENIRILRKEKGYSQETFAQQLNVVRQTVSKWEKGYSVPDAETLKNISELLETPVSVLLGSTVEEISPDNPSKEDEIAKQLAVLNNQLAERTARRRRIIKIAIWTIIIIVLIRIALIILFIANPGTAGAELVETIEEGMLIERVIT